MLSDSCSHLSTRAAVSLQVFDELWPGSVSYCDQCCAAVCQTVTNRKWRRYMMKWTCSVVCSRSQHSWLTSSQGWAAGHVPGVGSQSVRCVWTQTGDGRDTDAQIQALIGRPGLLPFCTDRSQREKQWGNLNQLWSPVHKCPSKDGGVSPESGSWSWCWSLKKTRWNMTDRCVYCKSTGHTFINTYMMLLYEDATLRSIIR